jgi:nucleolar complex protein 2
VEFIKLKRAGIAFSPNDRAVESFLQAWNLLLSFFFLYTVFGGMEPLMLLYQFITFISQQTEKEEQSSPLSKYVATLHQRAQDRMDALDETRFVSSMFNLI